MSTDLDRIPAPYRERVRALLTEAAGQAGCRALDDGDSYEFAALQAERAALAPFLAIADEADHAGQEAANSAPFGKAEKHYDDTRAAVWARRMAEHEQAAPADAMRAAADKQPDPMAAAMMRMTASAWTSAAAAPEDNTVAPDLAADAVRAVRSAQRAHLEATRAQAPRHAGPDCPDPCGVCAEQKAADLAALAPEGFLFGTVSANGEMVIHNGQGAQAALDALVRYLETHVSALPADLVQRAILALSMTLPAGPLAPTSEPVATLGVIVSLLRTLPIGRMPTVCLGGGAEGYKLLAARDGARTFTIAGTDETPPLRCVYVEYDGIEIKARCTREEVP